MIYPSNKSDFKVIHLSIFWLLVTSVAPFTFFMLSWHPYKILTFFIFIVTVLLLFLKRTIIIGCVPLLVIWLIQIVVFTFLFVIHQDVSYVNLILQNIIVVTAYFYSVNFIGHKILAISIVYCITLMSIMGVVAFFCGLLGMKPLSTFHNPDGRVVQNFLFTFTNMSFHFNGIYIIRYAGFFDEPGTFIFFLFHSLFINKIFLKNKKVEIILIVCGIFTFSIAFYVIIIAYFLLFYLNFIKPVHFKLFFSFE